MYANKTKCKGRPSSWQQVLTQRGRQAKTSGIASLAEEDGVDLHLHVVSVPSSFTRSVDGL